MQTGPLMGTCDAVLLTTRGSRLSDDELLEIIERLPTLTLTVTSAVPPESRCPAEGETEPL
jgi:hypothetical protein